MPLRHSIRWVPKGRGQVARERIPIFVTQDVLLTVQDELEAEADQHMLGFLVGELARCAETGVEHCVINSAIRVPLRLEGADAAQAIGRMWGGVVREARSGGGDVVGWYRTHPSGPVALTGQDVAAHLRFFRQPWQVALVVAGTGQVTAGGLFRTARGEAWHSSPEPFYEFLREDPPGASAERESVVAWDGYVRAEPQQRLVPRVGPSAPPATRAAPLVFFPDEFAEPTTSSRRWRSLALALAAVAVGVAALYGGWRLFQRAVPSTAPSDVPRREPAPAAAVAPVATAAVDSLLSATRAYRARARLFDHRQMTCQDLARGLVLVDERLIAYTSSRPGVRSADTVAAELFAGVAGVERHFEQSRCPRP